MWLQSFLLQITVIDVEIRLQCWKLARIWTILCIDSCNSLLLVCSLIQHLEMVTQKLLSVHQITICNHLAIIDYISSGWSYVRIVLVESAQLPQNATVLASCGYGHGAT